MELQRQLQYPLDKDDHAKKGFTAQAVDFTDVWEWGEAAAARLARITQGHMSRHHPLFPVRHAKKSISALSQFLPQKGMLAYLTYMAERLAFCHVLLKETGSIYLHCDPTASHYLKIKEKKEKGKKRRKIWTFFS